MQEIKAGVVLVTKFVSANDQKFHGYIDYIGRSNAVRNEKYTEYSIDSLQDELEKFGDYMDYMGNPYKTSELFTSSKDNLSVEEKGKLKEIFKTAQDNGSLMWQTVISFDNRWLAEHNLFDLETHTVNEAKIKECARGAMERILENENFAPSAIWSGAIHYNTKHIHVHLAMVEAFPAREIIQNGMYAGERKGTFKKSTLEKAKSFIANNIFSQQESNQKINELLRKNLVAALQDNIILHESELKHLYYEIYTKLPKNKRLWQYNRTVIRPAKADIDLFITKWIDQYHKEDFEQLKTALQNQQQIYQVAYGKRKDETKSNYMENKIEELYSRLGNVILTYLKTLEIQEVTTELGNRVSNSLSDGQQPDESDSIDKDDLSFYNNDLAFSDEQQPDDSDSIDKASLFFPDDDIEPLDIESLFQQYANYDLTENAAQIFDPVPQSFVPVRSERYKLAKEYMYNNKIRDFTKAFSLLSSEANQGNIYAIFDLAYLYSKGLGCEPDLSKANELYHLSLLGFEKELVNITYDKKLKKEIKDRQLPYLHFRIAKMYYYGLGTDIDKKKAFQHFNMSDNISSDGYIFSHYYLARFYENGELVKQNDKKAFNYYKSVADQSLSETSKAQMPYAVYKTAQMLEQGRGVKQNTSESQEYYKAALSLFISSNENNPDDQLQYRIGKMYYDGKGTQSDLEKAKAFFSSSAELGNDMANYMLAMIYLKDENADPELVQKAIQMLELSADPEKGNNALAQYQLGVIFIENNPEKGIYYLNLAAEQNNSFAQYKLGVFYAESDQEKSVSYFMQSAEQGNQFAQYRLGTILLKSESEEEQQKGLQYLTLSAEQGNQFAQYRLGVILLKSESEENQQKGLQYLTLSAEQGNQFAQSRLGVILLKSESPEERQKGLEFLTQSAEQENCLAAYYLGKEYFSGANLLQDCSKAESYLLQALKNRSEDFSSFTNIEYQLGLLYYNGGDNFEPNQQKGLEYLTIAAEQENQFAQYRLGIILLESESEEDQQKGLEYLTLSAEQGNQFAQYRLGIILLESESEEDQQKGLQYLTLSAEQGNQFAQYRLGIILLESESEEDQQKGLQYLTLSAEQENQFAQYRLGVILLESESEEDQRKGLEYLTLSAEQGNQFAQYRLGVILLKSESEEDQQKGLEYLTLSAKQGNQFAQYRLGVILLKSESEEDQQKGLEYLTLSAEQENQFAQYRLGVILLESENEEDQQKGLEYLTLSAEQGNQFAQYRLGTILLKSKNEEDRQKGLEYLTLSAEQENQFAQYQLGLVFLGSENQKDQQKGLEYLTLSAEQNNQFSQYQLGMYFFEKKNKTEQDIFTGLKFLKQAAEQDNCFAAYQLGKEYLSGDNVAQDCNKAEKYLLQALKNKDKDMSWFSAIEHQLGKLYFDGGDGFEPSTEKGMHFFSIAAEQGNQFAQYRLGVIYLYGLNGIEKDFEKANDYLSKSAAQGNEIAANLLAKINAPKTEYIKPLYLNLNINTNFSKLLRALGREFKSYDNYINQQIYEEMQRETSAES